MKKSDIKEINTKQKNINRMKMVLLVGVFSILSAFGSFAMSKESKKGLAVTLPDAKTAMDLGAKHIIMNNPIGANFDKALGILKSQGMNNTVIMFNPWNNGGNRAILPVDKPQPGAVLYGFNTSEEGKEALRKLADRYASSYGTNVDNWVIGNEINHQNVWNYMPTQDIDTYAEQYAQSYRIWYEAIKKYNPDANVYIPFDYRFQWQTDQGVGVWQAKPLMTRLNQHLRDTDYGIAWHAYPEDLADPDFTNDANAIDLPDAQIINMNNIHVLTDFMQTKEFLNSDENVRSIILSEQGFHATNEDIQAEMVEKAYKIALENPYIDIFFLSRERDLGEVHANREMQFGLMDKSGNKRKAYEVYKNLP